eukprot:2607586-Lingulodinium_polyedra.AAC.1
MEPPPLGSHPRASQGRRHNSLGPRRFRRTDKRGTMRKAGNWSIGVGCSDNYDRRSCRGRGAQLCVRHVGATYWSPCSGS